MWTHTDLGLHRLSLFAARRPELAWPLLLVGLALAIFGLTRITTEASLTKAFHAGTPEHATYQKLTSTFPGSEHDVFVIAEAKSLFQADALSALQELQFELPLIDHVASTASMFTLRKSVSTGDDPEPLFPDELPEEPEALLKLEHAVLAHPVARQRLLSPAKGGTQVAVFVVSLDPVQDDADLRKKLIDEISQIAAQTLKPAGIGFTLGGVPIARQELLSATQGDSKIFSVLGFVVGLIIGALVFRRWQFVIVASICPLIGIAAGIGMIGLFDGRYSPFMTGIPPLIMAIAFTDCMHLLFAVRRNVQAGMVMEDALYSACAEVGPACGIASLTTALALLTLTLAPSPLIQQFGLWAAVAALVAVCAVFLALPLFCRAVFRAPLSARTSIRFDFFDVLAQGCRQIGKWVRVHRSGVSVASLVLTVAVVFMYLSLEPRYRLSEQVPVDGSFRTANLVADRVLGGSTPVYVLVKWQLDRGHSDEKIFRAIADAHDTLAARTPDRNVLSLVSLGRGFEGEPDATLSQSVAAMKLFKAEVQSTFLSRERGGALVSVLLPDVPANELRQFATELDRALVNSRDRNPEFEYIVTGLPVLLAVGSPSLIHQINRSLLLAFIVVILMLGIMFKSWQVGVISLLPNVLPVLFAGCLVYVFAGGLEYASVIALTVGFGLAVDDTAHFFNRLRLEHAEFPKLDETVIGALGHVGPILVVTSIILVCGLAVTVFGELRTAYLFGTTCMAILVGALIADIIVLPAILFSAAARWKMRLWR